MDRQQLVNSLRSLLRYHQTCGISYYPADVKVPPSIEVLSSHQAEPPASVDSPLAEEHPQNAELPITSKRSDSGEKEQRLVDLHNEISRCRNCSLHQTRQVSTAGSGGTSSNEVTLMLVGDWLTLYAGSAGQQAALFGPEQDAMLARMMEAIELEPHEVYITNVIKCSIPEMCQPTTEHITSCSSYLQMQIDILQPLIICSMGIIASRLLTRQAKPLSQQRGKIYSYETSAGRKIGVIPTYHPTFLLQNPEMKQATWSDLQLIKREIGSR